MKITMSPILAGMSGKAGGIVAARNRYGAYFRTWSVPVNPRSTRQMTLRNRLASITNAWNEQLTSSQRSSWNTYASNTPLQGSHGLPVRVTGFNHFCRSNAAVLEAGATRIDDAPALFTLPETDPSLSFTASEASQKISVTFNNALEWANEVGGYLLVYLGKPQVNNRNFFNGPWHFAGKISGAETPPTSPVQINSPVALTQGQRVWLYARVLRADGRLSDKFRTGPVTVGA